MAEAQAKISIIIDGTKKAEAEFQSMFAAWNKQIAATGVASAEANLKLSGGLDKLVKSGRTASDTFSQEVPNALKRTAQEAEKTAEAKKKLEERVNSTSHSFRLFGTSVVDIAAKMYMAQVAMRNIWEGIKETFKVAELGAQVQQSDASFVHLLQTLGAAPDIMDKLREAAGGLATDYALQAKSAILLTGTSGQLGRELANNLPKLMEIARAAKVVNPAIRDVDYAYESLTTGIKRGEKRWLDNIGIIFRAEDAYKEYADKIGKATKELTAEEKQLAFLDKVLNDTGQNIIRQAGGVDSLTDKYAKLRTNLQETRQAGGIFLDNALIPIIAGLIASTEGVDNYSDALAHLGRQWTALTSPALSLIDLAGMEAMSLNELKGNIALVTEEIKKRQEAGGNLTRQETIELSGLIQKKYILQSILVELQANTGATGAFASAVSNSSEAVHASAGALADWKDRLEDSLQGFRHTQVNIFIKAADEAQQIRDRMTKTEKDAAQKELDVWKQLNEVDKPRAYRDFQEKIAGINDRYDKQRLDKLKEMSRVELELAGRLPLLQSDKIKQSISALGEQTDAIRSQISELEKLRDKALSGMGLREEKERKLLEIEIEQGKLQEEIAESGGQASLSQAKQLELLNLEWQQTRNSLIGTSATFAQEYEQQIATLNEKLAALDKERGERERELNQTLLQERLDILKAELEAVEEDRQDAIRKAQDDYDQQIKDLGDAATISVDKIKASTDTALTDLQAKLKETTSGIATDMKESFARAMLEMTEPGSAEETAILKIIADIHGVKDFWIADIDKIKLGISGPEGLAKLINDTVFTPHSITFPIMVDTGTGPVPLNDLITWLDEANRRTYTTSGMPVPPMPPMPYYPRVPGPGQRQHGGSVMSGHPYIVGEGGPELFVPSAGGAIVPNSMFGGGMNVTIQAGAFLGSHADAIRLGSQLVPIIAKGLQSYNLTPWSLGSRRTGTQ